MVLAVVDAGRVATLTAARGVQHRHLAGLLDVVSNVQPGELPPGVSGAADAAVAVAELVPGRTLERQLAQQPLAAGKAVAWILRLVDAVQALHMKGTVHGAISPWSVIAEPEGRAIAPTLAQLIAPAVGAYCPPERLRGGADAPSDDIWALHATLYSALTGKPPFLATQRDALTKQMLAGRPKTLAEHGLDEPALAEIVARGLMGERRLRVTDLGELSRALDGWERDPRALPAKRPPAPRPAPRSVVDLVATPAAARVDDIVIDGALLPVEGTQAPALVVGASAPRGQPPRLSTASSALPSGPPPLPVAAAPVASGPPPLPVASPSVAAAPPPLPVASLLAPGASSLLAPSPALTAPPPLPAVTAPPPLPAMTAPPTQPQAAAIVAAALPPLPPEPAWSPVPQASLSELVAQLPKAAPAPVALARANPPSRRLSFNPFERKRKLWPIVVGAAAMGGLGVYVAVGASGQPAPPPAPSAAAVQIAPKPRAPEKPKVSAAEARDSCVRSHFPERAFQAGVEFGFVCEEGDFREAARQLFTVVKQQPLAAEAGKAEAVAAGLSWYELPAASIIRKSCCVASTGVVLPETVGWCEQLQSAVRRIADDSDKSGDVAPGVRAFDKAVNCLYVHRINRPYTYQVPPTDPQRKVFQRFLSQAAISEASR